MKSIRTWKLKDRRSLFDGKMLKEKKKLEDLLWEQFQDVIRKVLKNVCGVANGKSQGSGKLQEAFKVWQQDRGNAEKEKGCKDSNKFVKNSVEEVKLEAEKDMYDELESKDGEAEIYRIAKIRQRDKTSQQYNALKTQHERYWWKMLRSKTDGKSTMKVF